MTPSRPVRLLGALFAAAMTLTLSAAGTLPAGAAGATPVAASAGARSLPAGATACRSTQAKPSSAFAACGPAAAASSAASTATVSLPRGAVACASTAAKPSSAAAACAATAAPRGGITAAAAAVPFSVKLVADNASLAPGGTATLTATSNQDVSPTPFFIEIFDATTGAFLVSCGTGTTCATSVTQSGSTVQNYVAYITDSGKVFPPPAPQATSSPLIVSWLTISLAGSPVALQPGGTTTLTATASLDVSTTPFFIEIFDATSGAQVTECGFGATCATSVTQTGSTVRTYVAYVSDLSPIFPPPDIRAQSLAAVVSWVTITLSISPTNLPARSAATVQAVASLDVGPTPFFIQVYDRDTHQKAIGCSTGSVCVGQVSQASPGQHVYIAYVSAFADTGPPPDIRATSDSIFVTWTASTAVVPSLVGDFEQEARDAITAAGLVPNVSHTMACIDPQRVLDQSPSGGTLLPIGSSVHITVDTGTPQTCIIK
jgi:hypothetical protein